VDEKPTLGVEEESAIIDPETRELMAHINPMVRGSGDRRGILDENILFAAAELDSLEMGLGRGREEGR
jgi:hypothetical protein